MFFVIVVLALIGLATLLGSSVSAAVGAAVLIPILLFKVLLIVAVFGFFGKAWHHKTEWRGRRPRRWEPEPPRQSKEDQFEEWHRLAHAKDEVDSWAPQD